MIYHEKFMCEWTTEEGNVEHKYYFLRLKNNTRAILNIRIWTVKETVARLTIRLAWFHKYPYDEAEVRRIEILGDKIFYVSPYDVVKILDYVPFKTLKRDEIDISNLDNVLRFIDNISRYFSDKAKNDLDRLVRNLRSYESYEEY